MDQKRNGYPLISVVTPSLNQRIFIEETIASVLSQGYSNLEYIVVDGGSSDNTLEILKKHGDSIKWISEPDRGQADALNRGFRMARGEILGWLNSDDTYRPGALNTVAEHFLRNPAMVLVYGEGYFIDQCGKRMGRYPSEEFNFKRLAGTSFICQPTVFMRAEVFREIGLLDTDLQTCLDYDYWIRIGRYYPTNRIGYLSGVYLANSRMHRENKTIRLRSKVYQEVMKTQRRYFGKVSKTWVLGYILEIILRRRFKV